MKHEIKILDTYASEHLKGIKPWELRKNDRNYKQNDTIEFTVVDYANTPTGVKYLRKIKYLYEGGVYGLQDGFCIMTIQ
tara:strand:+ start:76 stop:312 length:237 start_codon:yes stop_codon:yes gene_type:complete